MMTVPSIGDILMISQVARKTGRAFTAGRKDTPIDFQAVEIDISGFAHALKQLAETLHAETDVSLISRSDKGTEDGVAIILSSCQRIIHDLDSLVDRYQVIRKHRTAGGFAIERSWDDLVLSQYKTVMWTTEGGSLHDLSNLLQMHTKSVQLLTEAVQSSLTQLKRVVLSMAERFDSMCDLPGTLEDQLDDVTHLIQELAIPKATAQTPLVPQRNPARSPVAEASDPLSTTPALLFTPALPTRNTSVKVPSLHPRQRSVSAASSTLRTTSDDNPPALTGGMATIPQAPLQKHVSEFTFGGSSARDSVSSYASSTSSGPPRDSPNNITTLVSDSKSLLLPQTSGARGIVHSNASSLTYSLPPMLRSSSTHSTPDIGRIRSNSTRSPFPARQESIAKLHRSATTASQKAAFEKDAFRNSAVLCDVRGRLVEYSQQTTHDPERPSDFADIEMVEACDWCRIAMVRKRITDPHTKSVHVVTSIWAFSDDNNVRVELKMENSEMYVPYSSYFSPTKVSVTLPCELRFHSVQYGNRPIRTARTSWVNYVFEDSQAAALFQNEIMGRTLLATFRTIKTMRIHEGTLSSFAYAEQMCALENLRVWEDTDTGAIIGLIHFSASFRAGYLAVYLNSRTRPIKVQDVGGKEVKIKGLRVPLAEAGSAIRNDSAVNDADAITQTSEATDGVASGSRGRRASGGTKKRGKGKGRAVEADRKKIISGAKIEFASEMEKREFLHLVEEYQRPGRLCELPDLMAVN